MALQTKRAPKKLFGAGGSGRLARVAVAQDARLEQTLATFFFF